MSSRAPFSAEQSEKASKPPAVFEDAFKAFSASYTALEAENAALKEKVSSLLARLAVYEPDAELEQLVGSPVKESPFKETNVEGKKKEDEKKLSEDKKKPEETSKFRAVK